ncbi:unnamed protein product [Ilex paraguariensis]|uniref:Uncharacterized protein n=1 Tax=Ilex paraguariensis TaxID=185542 RepID=A0ABC8RT12_9AQUA
MEEVEVSEESVVAIVIVARQKELLPFSRDMLFRDSVSSLLLSFYQTGAMEFSQEWFKLHYPKGLYQSFH